MRLLLAGVTAVAVLGVPAAHADPAPDCNLAVKTLCMPNGAVTWCPDDGGHMVDRMGNCPSITFGRTPVGSVEPAR